jgi:hypothetical protein
MPKGLIFGLLGILATSWVMGLGVAGTQPIQEWLQSSNGNLGYHGEAPQLAVGQIMFGNFGFYHFPIYSVPVFN